MARSEGLRVGVLVSGSGTNLQALIDGQKGRAYEVVGVASNVPTAFALERARKAGIPTLVSESKGRAREEHEADVQRFFEAERVGFVALAGYMRVLTPIFVRAWKDRIVNVHPALLPSFPGTHAPRQALAYGAKVTGCTFHMVDAQVDHGPIVLQVAVPIDPADEEASLTARIQHEEHRHYPVVLDWFARGLITIEGRTVRFSGSASPAKAAGATRRLLASPDPQLPPPPPDTRHTGGP
ncbi:MAG: phosphoribosylglycinamide formyltransferase [Thermoplasmatota archaeon]